MADRPSPIAPASLATELSQEPVEEVVAVVESDEEELTLCVPDTDPLEAFTVVLFTVGVLAEPPVETTEADELTFFVQK